MTKHKGPGKANREGITVMQLADMFPNEVSATAWFEAKVWPNGRHCPRCGCTETRPAAKTAGLPYYCTGCQDVFSVRIGTALERSKVTLRQWVFAIYLDMTGLKSVSSMKLHRDIGVTQKTAWFMLHRIREAWRGERTALFSGPVEVDETHFGGLRKNMSKSKRKTLEGRGTVGKAVVVGAKDRKTNQVRAAVVGSRDAETQRRRDAETQRRRDAETLQRFVGDHAAPEATVYTETRPQGHVPQAFPQAPATLRQRVRRTPRREGTRHHRTDGVGRDWAGRRAPDVRRPDRRQWAGVGGTFVIQRSKKPITTCGTSRIARVSWFWIFVPNWKSGN